MHLAYAPVAGHFECRLDDVKRRVAYENHLPLQEAPEAVRKTKRKGRRTVIYNRSTMIPMGCHIRTVHSPTFVRSQATRRRRTDPPRSMQHHSPFQDRSGKCIHTQRGSPRSGRRKSSSILRNSVRKTTDMDLEPLHHHSRRKHPRVRRRSNIPGVPYAPLRSHFWSEKLSSLVHASSRNALTSRFRRQLRITLLGARQRLELPPPLTPRQRTTGNGQQATDNGQG